MEIINSPEFQLNEETIVCIGKFDGIHNGHRELISYAKKHKDGRKLVMFTFDGIGEKKIYTLKEKEYLAEQLNIDCLVIFNFDDKFKKISAHDFIEQLLIKQCKATQIVVGCDFRFGYERAGDVSLLSQYVKTTVFDKVEYHNQPISSSRIRNEIEQGHIVEANEMLGSPFFVKGTVVKGNQIGRTLEMPTSNQFLNEDKLMPLKGVYASVVSVNNCLYPGVSNYGLKPTVPGERKALLETHILGFDEDIYGQEIIVSLHDFLRPEQKFASLDELKTTMNNDKKNALTKVKNLIKE